MVWGCVVVGCTNKRSAAVDRSFHSFPFSDSNRLHRWIQAISRENRDGTPWTPSKNSRICSDHFRPEDYEIDTRIKLLRETAIPSIFPIPVTPLGGRIGKAMVSKRVSGDVCSAVNCRNARQKDECWGMSFFRLPAKDEPRCRKWIENMRRRDLIGITMGEVTRNGYSLCSKHFEASQFNVPAERKRLVFNAIPTLFDVPDPPATITKKLKVKERPYVAPPPLKRPRVVLDGHFINQKMAFEDERGTFFKQEYLRLYEKFQHLKELARINLDLLSLSVDLENVPGAKAELDRVHELVHALMTEECVKYMKTKTGCNLMTVMIVSALDFVDSQGILYTSVPVILGGFSPFLAQHLSTIFIRGCFSKIYHHMDPFDEELYEDNCQVLETDDMNLIENAQNVETDNTELIENTPVVKTEIVKLEHCEDNTSHMVMDPTNDTVMMNQPVVLVSRKTSKQPKKKRSRTSDSQPITLQNLITTGVPNIEKIDDEKKESVATVMPTEKIYEGEQCGVTLEDKNLFNQHQKIHTEEDNTCTVCGKQFSQKHWLKRHTQLHSAEKPFLCDLCGKRFHLKLYLKRHVARHDNNKPKFYCGVCGKPFAYRYSLSKHMIYHSQEKLKCSFCDKQYKSIDSLTAHERQHTEHFPHKCSKCGQGFKNPVQLNVHERIHIGENPVFTCSICHKTFSSKVQRNSHKRSHSHIRYQCKMHNCSVCQEQFRGNQAMAQHMLTHPEDLQFCILCQQTFDSPSDLQSHVTSTHLVEKLFKCPICGDEFSSGYKLSKHGTLHHSNINPLKCNDCGKSFSTKATLQIHRNAQHLKTKKYQCEYCGRNFYRVANFRRHVQNHQGLKPWKCSVCGKEFAQKASLETHSWTHRADKRYSCESCGRGFNEKRALLSHRKTQHQDQRDSPGMTDLTMVPI